MGNNTLRPKDAATLALLRWEGDDLCVLMGQRGKDQAFMPERYVFPGGGVEICDRYVKPCGELTPNVLSRLVRSCTAGRARSLAAAAIRETFEETGLMLSDYSDVAPSDVRSEWSGFHEQGLAPALHKLDYIFRAVTPPGRPRRFNARFFMAYADKLQGDIRGNGELNNIGWIPLSDALKMPIPHITGIVLREIQKIVVDPSPRDQIADTPYFHKVGSKYRMERE